MGVKYVKAYHMGEGYDLFSELPEYKLQNHGLKLQEHNFHLSVSKKIISIV